MIKSALRAALTCANCIVLETVAMDSDSTASNPGGLALSEAKLRVLEPWMFGWRRVVRKILGMLLLVDVLDMIDRVTLKDHLASGDARAAVVVSTAPLLVAAYSDDLDCVAMLRFSEELHQGHQLRVGTHLVSVNQYYAQLSNQSDLIFGPKRAADWSGFFPLIAEFLSEDQARIDWLKHNIGEDEWQRCRELGEAYLKERPGIARWGRPRRAHQAAGFMTKIVVGSVMGVIGIAAFIVLAWMFL